MASRSVRIGCRERAIAAAAALASFALPAFAAHPLLTEDTGTQGKGRFELELGLAQARDNGATALEFGPQLSYGALEALDLIARPTWLDLRGAPGIGTARGIGDTGLDFKWRFLDRDALSFGVRAGAAVPTGNVDKGLGNGKTSPHATLIAQYAPDPWMFAANVDYAYDSLIGDRRNAWGASAAAVYSANETWRFSAEVGTATNPDRTQSSWLTVARFGAIATVAPGIDLDVGWQVRLTHAAPAQVILAGATVHW
jgi:hypothetical protein